MPKLSYGGVVALYYAIHQLNATTHIQLYLGLSSRSEPIDIMNDWYYSQQITRKNLNMAKRHQKARKETLCLETQVGHHCIRQ